MRARVLQSRSTEGPLSKGTRITEATRKIITRTERVALSVGLVLVSYVISWEKNISRTVSSNVTSYFDANSVSGVETTVLSILQTALQPLFAKSSDMIGRATAYSFSVFMFMLAHIVMACARNYDTIIGGNVLLSFGNSGINILGPILIADAIRITRRPMALALYNLPMIITIFVTSYVAQAFLNSGHWRWAYGHVSILIVVCSAPLVLTLWNLERKAKKQGHLKEKQTAENMEFEQKGFAEKCLWISNEVDIVGVILLLAGLFLFLLPVSLATKWGGWQSGKTLGCLIPGIVIFIFFFVYEWKFAEKPFLPFVKWKSRNPVLGTLTMCMSWMIHIFMNGNYMTTYLRVSRRIDAMTASYVSRGTEVAHAVIPLVVGVSIMKYRNWKIYVIIGAAGSVLGTGLMFAARKSTGSIAFIVVCQVILGGALSFMNYPDLTGVQASVPRADVASITTFYEVGMSISGSIASAIASSLWNNVLPGYFEKYVPGKYNYKAITGSIDTALALPQDQYEGVVKAYDAAMHLFCIVSVCFASVGFVMSFFLKGFDLNLASEDPAQEESEKHEHVENLDQKDKVEIHEEVHTYHDTEKR